MASTSSFAGAWRIRWGVPVLIFGAVLTILITALGCRRSETESPTPVGDASRIEGVPMCPWRHPREDCARWFPEANHAEAEIQILSALRAEMAERLGRPPSAEDNARHVHRVLAGPRCLGEVVVQRVRGDSGALEVVVGLDPDGSVLGVRLQRSREPAPVLSAVEGQWLGSFRGRKVGEALRIGVDLPLVPPEARPTAEAIQSAIRKVLILRDLASSPRALRRPDPEASIGRL